jgi:chemotaxis protein CheD
MAIIKVGMADLKVAKNPDILTTLGLGSCVGIALFDATSKISGLAHIMLPDSTQIKNNTNIAKFADTGAVELLNCMIKLGANKNRIVAKLAGGAQMFEFSSNNDIMKIGQRNVLASKEVLSKLGIRIISEDTGLNYGRTIELNSENGELLIKTIGKGQKVI